MQGNNCGVGIGLVQDLPSDWLCDLAQALGLSFHICKKRALHCMTSEVPLG